MQADGVYFSNDGCTGKSYIKGTAMKKSLLGVVALVLAGCGLPQGSGQAGIDLSKGCKTCGVANKVSDKKCGEDKCFTKVCEPVMTEVKVPVYEDVNKECYVVERKKEIVKVPVTTYKVVEEWVDSPVREAYYETVKVRAKRRVPVTDEKFVYAKIPGEVEMEIGCPKITTGYKEVCKPVRVNDRIVRYDKCGKVEELPITREGSVVVHQCERTIENAVCSIKRPGLVEKPMFVNDNTTRNGYYTDEVKVKKYRIVPGKVLRKRRIPQTVMVDKVNWVEEKRPVTRQIREKTGEKTEKKIEYVTRKVEVDCQTGVPAAANAQLDNAKDKAAAAEEVAATAAAAEVVKDAVTEPAPAPAAAEAVATPAAPAEVSDIPVQG